MDRSELLVQPEAMKKANRAGAAAAAKYYMGLFEYVFLTGDLDMWDEMALPECQFCAVVAKNVEIMHEAGNHQVSGPPEWVGKVKTDRVVTMKRWHVTLRATVSPTTTIDRDGEVIARQDGAQNRVTLAMHHDGDSWRTAAIEVSDDR